MEETFWLWKFLGRLHPMVVHFPLGLILFAAILELFTLKKFISALRPGIKVCLIVGVVAALFSAGFGWLLAYGEEYTGDTLSIHQWFGIGTAALGSIVLIMMIRLRRQQTSSGVAIYRTLLFATALGITVTGHFGASLTHGEEYLTEVLPAKDFGGGSINFASMNNDTAKLSKDQEKELNTRVRAIFAHNCYKCHGATKVKGELRLDSKDMAMKGGESGEVIIAGKPHESDLIRRVMLPRDDEEAMPPKGKMLSQNDVDLLNFWVLKGAPWPEDAEGDKLFRVAKLEPRNPVLPNAGANHSGNPIDLWVNEYFKKNKVEWQPVVDDRIFLRRIYLDIVGLLPPPEALDSFVNDRDAGKRAAWVRKLLNRNDDYAINWLTFWNDALRNDYTGTGYITGGRSDITNWLYQSLRDNKPYNQFVKELISPSKESKGFIEGIRWRGVVNASQGTEIQAAQNVAQVFLGLNLKCASCHNSFINNWKLEDAYAFANIFSDSSLEINRCDKPTGKYTSPKMLWEQLGRIDSNAKHDKKQQQLADIMTKPENGRLARTMVNRIWAQLMGRGIVEPVDVMDNAPWSQDLLDWLSFEFASKNYNLKELIYLIATSQTYQQPSVGFKDPNKLMTQDYVFTGMVRRRMSGEKFSDAVSNLVWPMFGDSMVMYKPVINTDTTIVRRASLMVNNSFLTALGRPNRETVSTGRESQANLLQALELTNGTRFNAAMKKGAERWKSSYSNTDTMIKAIYLNALNRSPSAAELKIAKQALSNNPSADTVADLLWSIMLLPEFQLIY